MTEASGRPAQNPTPPAMAPPPGEKPPLWPTLIVVILTIPVASIVSGVVLAVAVMARADLEGIDSQAFMDAAVELASTPLGLALLILPAQLVFAGVAFGGALASQQSISERIGITTSRIPARGVVVLMLGTPFVGVIGYGLVMLLTDGQSESLEFLMQAVTETSGVAVIISFALISVVPGVAEECFFRGYLQRQLLARWPAAVAIAFSAVLFATAHLNVVHSLGVLPLGVWLGLIAWRTGSVWPAIACHIANNLTAALTGRFLAPPSDEVTPIGVVGAALVLTFAIAFAASILILVRIGGSRPGPLDGEVHVERDDPAWS